MVSGTNQCDRFCEVRFKQIRYGLLGLAPGYLVSHHFPDILQRFAHTCAMLLAFAEHQEFIQHLLGTAQPLFPPGAVDRLTRRERDVLSGLMKGLSDAEMAHSLGIEPTTVHTHRKRLYSRLGVHNAQEAILRCFTHRLINWLDTSVSVD
jgi:DNA-binding NarL/FixJ family response regulator